MTPFKGIGHRLLLVVEYNLNIYAIKKVLLCRTMPLKPLDILRKGLKSLENEVKAKRDHLFA